MTDVNLRTECERAGRPTNGQVLWCGAVIQRDLVQYRKRLGYVPEEPDLDPFLSGWEYLELIGTLRGLPRKSLTARIDALLALFSLENIRRKREKDPSRYRYDLNRLNVTWYQRLPTVIIGPCLR